MSKISEYKAIMQNPQKLEKGQKPKTNDELRIEFGVSATVDEINQKEKYNVPIGTPETSFASLDFDNEELKRLEDEKDKKTTELKTKKDRVALINAGRDSEIVELKDAEDNAYQEYIETLNDTKKKSKDPQIQQLIDNVIANENSYKETEKAIQDCDDALADTNTQIASVDANISALESENQAYKSRIDILKSKITNDSKDEIQGEISNLNRKIGQITSKKQQELELKKILNDKKEEIDATKLFQTKELERLSSEKTKLDSLIEQKLGDNVKTKKSNYELAKKNFNNKKSELLEKINAEIQQQEQELLNLETQINRKKQEIYLKKEEETVKIDKEDSSKESTSPSNDNVYGNNNNGDTSTSQGNNDISTEKYQQLLDDTKKNLELNKTELFKVYDGSNLVVNNAKSSKDTAFEYFINKLNSKDSATLNKIKSLKSNLDSKEKELDNIDKEIINAEIEDIESSAKLEKCNNSITSLRAQKEKLNTIDKSQLSPEKMTELTTKEGELNNEISRLEQELQTLNSQKNKVDELKAKRVQVGAEYEQIKQNLLSEMDAACNNDSTILSLKNTFTHSLTTYETTKNREISSKKEAFDTSIGQYKNGLKNLNDSEIKDTSNKYNFGSTKCDFDLTLTDYQKQCLGKVKDVFIQNRDKYEKVSRATGVPPELICAIHYRESSCKFNTYLHNGDPLGSPTVHVPKGKMFTDWTEAAIDALKSVHVKTDSTLESQLDFAEHFNGLGYKKRGVTNPYLWAGTDNYTTGQYVRDGVYSATAVDKRVGVAAILKTLYEA